MDVTRERNLGMVILLTIVTCGIYGLYFLYKYAQDVNTMCEGDGKHTQGLLVLILLSLVTCGIYSFFWYYAVGNRVQENAQRYGVTISDNGTTFLLFLILGSVVGLGSILLLIPMVNAINKLTEAYMASKSLVEVNE